MRKTKAGLRVEAADLRAIAGSTDAKAEELAEFVEALRERELAADVSADDVAECASQVLVLAREAVQLALSLSTAESRLRIRKTLGGAE